MTQGWNRLAVMVVVYAGFAAATGCSKSAPQPLVTNREPIAASACVDCHDDIVESFATAPHSYTLRPGSDSYIVSCLAGKEMQVGDVVYSFELVDDELRFSSSDGGEARVDWVFGSGHHALTPITLSETSTGRSALIQLYSSWFPDDTISITPGIEEFDAILTKLGRYHGFDETVDCFGCHATYLPVDEERIDYAHIETGVSCRRCHFGSEQHVDSGGEAAMRSRWKDLTALKAINRCGECHRRVDEFTDDELVPSNPLLLRFAPVGLALSKCFQAANAGTPQASGLQDQRSRLDCITCHDPHQPAEKSPSFYVEKCLQCHGTRPEQATVCSAEPMSSQCLRCHMPKSDSDTKLNFTDHWIRIREQ